MLWSRTVRRGAVRRPLVMAAQEADARAPALAWLKRAVGWGPRHRLLHTRRLRNWRRRPGLSGQLLPARGHARDPGLLRLRWAGSGSRVGPGWDKPRPAGAGASWAVLVGLDRFEEGAAATAFVL